jgi:AcrR family transcriptional regulator
MKQSYCITLEQKLRNYPPKKKRDRTQAALKIATAKLLEQGGYENLRVADIARMAGVGAATFHDYFDNRNHAAKQVMSEFVDAILSLRPEQHSYNTAFAGIYFTTKALMELYQSNVGLMKCMFQLGDRDEEFGQLWRSKSTDWNEVVTRTIIKRHLIDADEEFVFMIIYSVAGMVDEFMRGLYVYKDAPILNILKRYDIGESALAYFLAVLWYRSIFGKNPSEIPSEIDPKIVSLFKEKLHM